MPWSIIIRIRRPIMPWSIIIRIRKPIMLCLLNFVERNLSSVGLEHLGLQRIDYHEKFKNKNKKILRTSGS
jgi:hypothetical protein